LQQGEVVLAASDQGEDGVAQLQGLVGLTVLSVKALGPAWDLRIAFDDGKELVTFSDHVQPNASIDTNWELWAGGSHLSAGPGSILVKDP
jgi:hypothetical protein